jgi:hypothetical protein
MQLDVALNVGIASATAEIIRFIDGVKRCSPPQALLRRGKGRRGYFLGASLLGETAFSTENIDYPQLRRLRQRGGIDNLRKSQ